MYVLTAPAGIASLYTRSGDEYVVSNGTITVPLQDLPDALASGFTLGSGGGGGISRIITSISSNTTAGSAANTDYVYLVSGTVTLTFPTAAGNTNRYSVKNVGTGVVTLGGTFDGGVNPTISSQYSALDAISNNSTWNII